MKKNLFALLIGSALFVSPAFAGLPAPDADDDGLSLPPGFHALIYADNVVVGKTVGKTRENLRGLAVAPNGDVYAKGHEGQIFALRDTNGDGRADVIEQFGPGELVPSSPLEVSDHDLAATHDHDQKAFA